MAIKNFLSTVLATSFILTGCQQFKIADRSSDLTSPSTGKTESSNNNQTPNETSTTELSTPSETPKLPKIAIVLGPGGALSYAHIGVLEELHKAKMPIDYILGIEWGSLPAALYARSAQASDSEWQAMKIPNDFPPKKSLLTGKTEAKNPQELKRQLQDIFQTAKIEHLRIPFSCLSLDMSRRTPYFRTAGELADILPTCMSYPPILNPDRGTVAYMNAKIIMDFLASKGIKYLIYVSPLAKSTIPGSHQLSPEAQILWTYSYLQSKELEDKAHYVIRVDTAGKAVDSFDGRRALIAKGKEAGVQAARTLAKQLGF